MPTLCQKIALTIFGVGCFAVISTPIPSLLSHPEPLNVWIVVGLVFSNLALIQLLLLEDYKPLIVFTPPNYSGIISGVGAAIYQVLLLGKGDWEHRYAIAVLLLMATVYSGLIFQFVTVLLDPVDEWYSNTFIKRLTQAALGFYFFAFPTTYLYQTLLHSPGSHFWIYINYGLILAFLLFFTVFVKIHRLSIQEPDPVLYQKLVKFFIGFYFLIYIPLAIVTITYGYREYKTKAAPGTDNQYFAFLLAVLGSTCAAGIFIIVVFPTIYIGYCAYRLIRRLFENNNNANLPESSLSNSQDEQMLHESAEEKSLRQSLVAAHFEETNEKSCSICWQEFSEANNLIKVAGCNHTFHEACLLYWCQKSDTCPLCRVKIKVKSTLENTFNQFV